MSCKNTLRKPTRSILFLSFFACIICCSLPFLAIAISSAGLIALANHAELMAVLALATGVLLTVFMWWKSRHAPSCSVNCGCKDQAGGKK
jgi:hypothetical protein